VGSPEFVWTLPVNVTSVATNKKHFKISCTFTFFESLVSTHLRPNPILKGMASATYFHCSICFENFDSKERYPVVLPCGHSFVCVCCAKQLTRCMECRQSLYHQRMTPSIVQREPRALNVHRRNSVTARGSSHQQSLGANCATQSLKKGFLLPMPKNLLLLSLMEIADYSGDGKCTNGHTTDVFHEVATNTLASECGTYVAIAKEGLDVVRSIPIDFDDDSEETALGEMNIGNDENYVDAKARNAIKLFKHLPFSGSFDDTAADENMERVAHLFQHLPFHDTDEINAGSHDDVPEIAIVSPPHRYEFGQKIQITEIKSGWARLARGKGFIKIDSKKLVKVCGPSDNACRLEGTMIAVRKHCQNLRRELRELTDLKSLLKAKLTVALKEDYQESTPNLLCGVANDLDEDSNGQHDTAELQQIRETTEGTRGAESAPPIDSSALTTYDDATHQSEVASPNRLQEAPEEHPFDIHFFQRMCLPQKLVSILRSISSDDESSSSPSSTSSFVAPFREGRAASSPENALRTAATHPLPHHDSNDIWELDRYGNFRPMRRSQVDFRTGMSNHSALLSAYHSHARGISKSPPHKTSRMSGHMGLTSTGSFSGRSAHTSTEMLPNATSPVLLPRSLPVETIRENEPTQTSDLLRRNGSDHSLGTSYGESSKPGGNAND